MNQIVVAKTFPRIEVYSLYLAHIDESLTFVPKATISGTMIIRTPNLKIPGKMKKSNPRATADIDGVRKRRRIFLPVQKSEERA